MNAFSARRTIAIQALSELTIPAVCVVMFALFSHTERGGTLPASVSPTPRLRCGRRTVGVDGLGHRFFLLSQVIFPALSLIKGLQVSCHIHALTREALQMSCCESNP